MTSGATTSGAASPPGVSARPTISELLAAGGHSYSFEFFPPKTDAGEHALWQAIHELEALGPTFVSVTYGAGGSTRERTVRMTAAIAADTTLTPVGHLTCVGHTRDELRGVIGAYAGAEVRNVLALRGDPAGGPGAVWQSTPGGIDHAVDLVALLKELGDFCVGVAAFPEGHPEAQSLAADAAVLARKADAGAEFAITQLFFDADDYFALVERAAQQGTSIPVIPGIMPVTDVGQVERFSQLSGAAFPADLAARFDALRDDPAAVAALGVESAVALCGRLLDGGAPGLHFYTLNRSSATREIYQGLGLGG